MGNYNITKVTQILTEEEVKSLISDYIAFVTNEYTYGEDMLIDKYIYHITPKHCHTCKYHFSNPFDQIFCHKGYDTEKDGCNLKYWEKL